MPRLNECFLTHPNQQIQGNHVFIHFSNMTFFDVESFLSKKHMLNKEIVIIHFSENKYLDDLFLDDNLRPQFENMVFNLLEKFRKYNRFLYFAFEIKNQNLNELIHNGFYEWLEYWMLFFKFTHANFILEVNEQVEHMPIEYILCKRIDNPRLSLFINISSWDKISKKLPEDIGVFTMIAKQEQMINNGLQYATMYIN